jgi:glutathione synthase/RimK-type ligase-like ATP-grasp enzyme
MHQKYVFDHYKIPSPKTDILTLPDEADDFFQKTSYPVLIKNIWGFGGEAPKQKTGIIKLDNKKEAGEFLTKKIWPPHLDQINQDDYIYVQKLINISSEYRIITVGQKIILAYEKKSDQLLKHVWRGAKISWQVEDEIKKFIKKINKILRLDWCGWDVIKDKKGSLMLLEINPIFGTKALEQKGVNLADHLAEYVTKQLKNNYGKRRN